MARRLQLPYLCLSIFLLVLPLVCSKDEENNGMNDVGELLQKLLKAEKERRTMSDDTNVEGSGGTGQGHTNKNENGPETEVIKSPDGEIKTEVKVDGEITQKILQDCENKYQLIMNKGNDKAGSTCLLTKMDDLLYQKNCKGTGTNEEIDTQYKLGLEITDSTLLSTIKGIDGCNGKPIYELIKTSVKRRDLNEYEKRLAEGRGCSYCNVYETVCNWVCAEKAGWWWGEHCVRNVYECVSRCKYDCR